MKFSSMIFLSAPLVGMASAGYLVKTVPGNKVIPKGSNAVPKGGKAAPKVGHRSPFGGQPGCDNSLCPKPPNMGCFTSTRHSVECGNGNDECWVVPRDCASLCNCLYYNPINSLLDSCARGTPGTDDYQCNCIFQCSDSGLPENGNGLCTPEQDVCKKP